MIDAIVFDVGRVLIDYSYDRLFSWMKEQGAVIESVDDFAEKVDLEEYEKNQFDDGQFLERLAGLMTQPVSRTELITRWNDLFTPIPSMMTLAEGLKENYRVYLLSNTSGLHWWHLWRTFELDAVCHDGFASYQLRAMKPDESAYRELEKRFGLDPERTILIDDKDENIEGARRCGWMGIHHCCNRATRERLRLLGVQLPDLPPETA